jgi:protease-4
MSEAPQPVPPAPTPPPPAPRTSALGCAFVLSVMLNLFAAVVIVVLGCLALLPRGGAAAEGALGEEHVSGDADSHNKVAVIRLDGVILEGLLGYVHRQIDQAAKDDDVKAVVLRINSPGGSITASDDLHRRLTELARGNVKKKTKAKPIIVSMGSLAASGGYYVAMPGKTLFAERTTLTGSIGVYASFPNVKELADRYGVKFETVKQGEIKNGGSPFAEMSVKERQVWQDMVDNAYRDFLGVVEKGRPDLEGKLLERFPVKPRPAGPEPEGEAPSPPQPYTRYRADGGIFTADKALELGLIDKIGYLEDAILAARDSANLGEDFQAVQYERPRTFLDLLGVQADPTAPSALLDPARLQAGLSPRVWYLSPGHEAAGLFAAAEASRAKE